MSTKYDVILRKVPGGKDFRVAEILHRVLNLDLKEAGHIVQSLPLTVMERVSEEKAVQFQQDLEALGLGFVVTCKSVMNPILEILQVKNDDLNDAYILDKYHLALTCVNNTYKELQDAKKELVQYEEILKEALELAEKFQLKKVPSSSAYKLESCTPISIEITKEVLDNLCREMQEFNSLHTELKTELSSFQQESEQTISQLQTQNAAIQRQIEINSNKIELVKKLVKEVCFCCFIFLLTVLFNPSLILTVYIAMLMLLIGCRLYMINPHPLEWLENSIASFDDMINTISNLITRKTSNINLIRKILNKVEPIIDELTQKILVVNWIAERDNLLKEEEQNRQQIPITRAIFNERKQKNCSNKQLKNLENEAIISLSIIVSYVNLAHQRVSKILPRRLREVQNYQQELINSLMSLVNESRANKGVEYHPRLLALPWNNPRWTPSENNTSNYYPQINNQVPGILRLGELREVEYPSVEQAPFIEPFPPALIPIRALDANRFDHRQGHIVIFSHDANSRNAAVGAIQSIALRIICTFPILQLRCVFIDPVGMGNNFPFNNIPDFIAGPKTFTRSDDIREQLRNLTTHVEQVIQNYLGKDYETIEDFNRAKSFVKEAYRYLFIADFPTHFDTSSLEDLKSLLSNGARAGVYVVLHIDETIEKLRDFKYEFFNSYCTVLQAEYENNQNTLFTTQLPSSLNFKILLDQPPKNEQFNKLKDVIAKASKEVKTETVPYQEILPKEPIWSDVFDSRKEIRAAIGVVGAREKLEFWLGQNEDGLEVSHALLAGKPGAGKSYTLHAIITSLTTRYAPDELELYLLDFKEGVEFQLYIDPERSKSTDPNLELSEDKALPHARVISIESDREFGLSVLKYIQNLLEERGRKFKDVGVSNLKDYRDKCGKKMPRILVVIDEFQYMFRENDNITQQLNSIFEDITKRGRAFGIHLLLASQSPNVTNINRSIYSFIDLRMAQQMDKNTAALVLAEGNADAVDLLDRPGKIIYNHDFGRRSYNRIGQVADMSSGARQKTLLDIQLLIEEKSYKRQQPLILFDGTRATKLSHNLKLTQLSEMSHWLSPKDLNKEVLQDPDWLVEETPGVAWLGEAMRIGNHTKAIFRLRSRSNMLLVGTSEETIFGILGGILLSLIHCYEPLHAEFQIIDLSSADNSWTEMFVIFQDAFAQYFPVTLGKRFPKPETQIMRAEIILQNIYTEFERRQQQRKDNPDEINQGASIFFVCAIGGLNRFQNLRPVAGRRGEEISPDAEKLVKLVSSGPELGIHTIVWVDDMKTFFKVTPDSKAWLTHFDLRVGLRMPENDSRQLLSENYAHNLPRLRAYFRDESTTTGMEKFKPYSVPSAQEIINYSERLKQRCLG